jgi:dolichol-phosphate mannosyltransferase
MKLSVVIPARNEEGNIDATLCSLRSCLRHHEIPYEIVVVDDGSEDATAAIVRALSADDCGIRLIVNEGQHGFGHAIRAGLDAFTGDAVVIMMADCSDAPDDVARYYYILRDEADCVFGSRFIAGSRIIDYPKHKLVVNRIANRFISTIFGIRFNDVTNAFKGYRSYVIDGCKPFLSPHFNLTVEIPLKAITRGYSYRVTPISWTNRKTGISKLKIKEMGSRYLFIVLNVWLERMLTRDDYRRPRDERFVPWPRSALQPSRYGEGCGGTIPAMEEMG